MLYECVIDQHKKLQSHIDLRACIRCLLYKRREWFARVQEWRIRVSRRTVSSEEILHKLILDSMEHFGNGLLTIIRMVMQWIQVELWRVSAHGQAWSRGQRRR